MAMRMFRQRRYQPAGGGTTARRRSGYRWRALAACALLVGLAAVHPAGVRAATDTVSVCDDSGAAGTLRSVISGAARARHVTLHGLRPGPTGPRWTARLGLRLQGRAIGPSAPLARRV